MEQRIQNAIGWLWIVVAIGLVWLEERGSMTGSTMGVTLASVSAVLLLGWAICQARIEDRRQPQLRLRRRPNRPSFDPSTALRTGRMNGRAAACRMEYRRR